MNRKQTRLQRLREMFSEKFRTIISPGKKKTPSGRPWSRVVQNPEGLTLLLWGLGDGSVNGSFPLSTGQPFRIDRDDAHLKFTGDQGEILFGGPDPEINRRLAREIEKALKKTRFGHGVLSQIRFPLLPMLAGGGVMLILVLFLFSGETREGSHLASLSQVEKMVSQGVPDSFPGLGGGLTCHGGGH